MRNKYAIEMHIKDVDKRNLDVMIEESMFTLRGENKKT